MKGAIKANILHRFALKLPQSHDSRVILDENGAETLLGRGAPQQRPAPPRESTARRWPFPEVMLTHPSSPRQRPDLRQPLLVAALVITAVTWPAPAHASPWRQLEPGLELAVLAAHRKSFTGDSKVTVLRIDPSRWAFRLLTARALGSRMKTADAWAKEHKLVAVINASMFLTDGRTSTGLMRGGAHVNNPKVHPDFGAFFVFGPRKPGLPPVQLVDRYAVPAWREVIDRYETVVQNYRMISASRKNLWSRKKMVSSIACVAVDGAGRVLFIHSRSPYTVHDFNEILLRLPLDVRSTMYVEGGPEASLFVSAGGHEVRRVGSYERGFFDETNEWFWPMPNVLGVTRVERRAPHRAR